MAGRYTVRNGIPENREILKTSLIYHDRKTAIPKSVLDLLGLKPGRSRIVWVAEKGRIHVESAKQTRR